MPHAGRRVTKRLYIRYDSCVSRDTAPGLGHLAAFRYSAKQANAWGFVVLFGSRSYPSAPTSAASCLVVDAPASQRDFC